MPLSEALPPWAQALVLLSQAMV